jgi:hypothetical protein
MPVYHLLEQILNEYIKAAGLQSRQPCSRAFRQNGWQPAMCRPPTKFTSFPFRQREQFLSDGRLNRRERCGDIFKAFARGVDAEEPSHEPQKIITPDPRT